MFHNIQHSKKKEKVGGGKWNCYPCQSYKIACRSRFSVKTTLSFHEKSLLRGKGNESEDHNCALQKMQSLKVLLWTDSELLCSSYQWVSSRTSLTSSRYRLNFHSNYYIVIEIISHVRDCCYYVLLIGRSMKHCVHSRLKAARSAAEICVCAVSFFFSHYSVKLLFTCSHNHQ